MTIEELAKKLLANNRVDVVSHSDVVTVLKQAYQLGLSAGKEEACAEIDAKVKHLSRPQGQSTASMDANYRAKKALQELAAAIRSSE